nr:unnamed protein product [Callosobruchus chinensis]
MVLVRGEALCRIDLGEAKGICKSGWRIEAAKPAELSIGM